jgi:predicted DsbA family dithiol-disulfide isomerase
MDIDIFHDTVCPWCWIGQQYLFKALNRWDGEPVKLRWHPFLIDSSIPPQGYEFRPFLMQRKGLNALALQHMLAYTRQAGCAAGIDFVFDKIRLAVNSTLSHCLIALTPDESKPQIVEAVYKAYFQAGLNIADLDTLVRIGQEIGLNSEWVRRQLNDSSRLQAITTASIVAHQQGISGVPLVLLNGRVKVEGAHSVDVILQALNQAALIGHNDHITVEVS